MSLFDRDGKAPIDVADVLLADLDGVVYRGPHAIPGAVEALNGASDAGIRVGYLTNNASRTDEQVATHLRALGLRVTTAEVITSPQAAMLVLQNLVPAGSLILVIGGDGIVDELQKAGYRVTRSADDQPAAVVQGFSPDLGWKDLAEAAYALAEQPNRDPIPWVATNTDWTIPQARGIAPGNGTLVSAVHTAVQRLPVFAGKPETPMFEAALSASAREMRSCSAIGSTPISKVLRLREFPQCRYSRGLIGRSNSLLHRPTCAPHSSWRPSTISRNRIPRREQSAMDR